MIIKIDIYTNIGWIIHNIFLKLFYSYIITTTNRIDLLIDINE